MTFTVRGVQIAEAIARIKKIINPEFVSVSYHKGKLTIAGRRDDNRVRVFLPAEGKEDLRFTVETKVLASACAKRQELAFKTVSESEVSVTEVKGTYRYTFNTSQYDKVPFTSKQNGAKLPTGMQDILLKWLPDMILDPLLQQDNPVVMIDAGAKGVRMACSDPYHAVIYRNTQQVGDLQLNMPATLVAIIADVLDPRVENYLGVEEPDVYFWNEGIELAFPQVSTDKTIDSLMGLAKPESKAGIIDCDKLPLILNNLNAFDEVDATIACRKEAKVLHLAINSTKGKASDGIELKGALPDGQFNVHPKLFNDTIRHMSGETQIYLNGQQVKDGPYSLVIMRKGSDQENLSAVCMTSTE